MSSPELPDKNDHADRSSLEAHRRFAFSRFIHEIDSFKDQINHQRSSTDDEFLLAQLDAHYEQILALIRITYDAIRSNSNVSFNPDEKTWTNPENIYPYGQPLEKKNGASLTAATIVGSAAGTESFLSKLVPDGAPEDYFTHHPLSRYDEDGLPGTFDNDGNLTILAWTSIPRVSIELHFPHGDTSAPKKAFPDSRIVNIDQIR